MTNVEKLAALFGSKQRLADICEVHKSLITYWVAHGGDIPPKYHTRIKREAWAVTAAITPRDAAEAMAVEIMACIPGDYCPCCGRPKE